MESRTRSRGKPLLLAERRRQHFRAEARSAHAEQDRVGEPVALHRLREILIVAISLVVGADRASPASGPRRRRSRPTCRAAKAFGFCRATRQSSATFSRLFFELVARAQASACRSARPALRSASWRRRREACRRRRRTAARRPSTSLSVTSSSEMPARSSSPSTRCASAGILSRLSRSLPWSRNASSVASGMVLTVSGPISSST